MDTASGQEIRVHNSEIEEIKRLYLQEGRSILQIPKILGKGSETQCTAQGEGQHGSEERTSLSDSNGDLWKCHIVETTQKAKKLKFHARCSCGYEFDVDPFG